MSDLRSKNKPERILDLPLNTIRVDAETLYNTVRRGVKSTVQPWKFAQDHPEILSGAMQEAFDNEIDKQTKSIMIFVIDELFIP